MNLSRPFLSRYSKNQKYFQIMLISSLFMHRYLLSNMDETQMDYLQNIRAMSPFMLHYDINGGANLRNGEK